MSQQTKPIPMKARRGGLAIYEQMRDDILWLRVEPGSAIDEVSLAKKYGVSRTPIREAVSRLASEGLVNHLPNRTSIVSPIVMLKHIAFFDMYYLLSRAVVRDATLKYRTADSKRIEEEAHRLTSMIADDVGEETQKAELKLRQNLSALSDNFFRDNAYRVILDAGIRTKFLYLFPNCHEQERSVLVSNWHQLMCALQAGDADQADQAVTKQIRFEAHIIEQIFKSKPGPSMSITPPKVVAP